MLRYLTCALLLLGSVAQGFAADWTLPVTLRSGSATTSLTLGIQAGATNGYDAGKDSPTRAYEDEVLYATFPHPEWGVVLAGKPMPGFLRDIRGTLPQTFVFEVRSLQSAVTVSWLTSSLPDKTTLFLKNPTSGATVDMSRQSSYSFSPGGPSPVSLQIVVSQGDVSAPQAPYGVRLVERETSLAISWQANSESDLAGYKVHFGTSSGQYLRTIDVRNVLNYNLLNLNPETTYYVAVSAYDKNGNESAKSAELSGKYDTYVAPPPDPEPEPPAVDSGGAGDSTQGSGSSPGSSGTGSSGGSTGTTTSTTTSSTSGTTTGTGSSGTTTVVGTINTSTGSSSSSSSTTSNTQATTGGQENNPPSEPADSSASTVTRRRSAGGGSVLAGGSGAPKQESQSLPGVGGVTVSVEGRTAVISWAESKDPKVAGYRLYYGFEAGKYLGYYDVGLATSYVVYGINESANHIFAVAAYDDLGKEGPLASAGAVRRPKTDDKKSQEEQGGEGAVKTGAGLALEATLTYSGPTLLSIPLDAGLQDIGNWLVAAGLSPVGVHGWNARLQKYAPLMLVHPGEGFLVSKGPGKVKIEGARIDADAVEVPLLKGWNLIGVPYEGGIPLKALKIAIGKEALDFQSAVNKKWAGEVNTMIDGKTVKVDKDGKLDSWHGYWLYAYRPATLLIPAPSTLEKADKKAKSAQPKQKDKAKSPSSESPAKKSVPSKE